MGRAKVSFHLARTLNMGNYESTKVSVGLELERDGSLTRQEVEDMYEKAKSFVEGKVKEEEAEWRM